MWGLFVTAASVTISYTDLPIFVFPVPTTECGCVINWINQVQHLKKIHLWSRAAQTCYQFRKNKIKYILFIIKKKHHKEVKTLKSNQPTCNLENILIQSRPPRFLPSALFPFNQVHNSRNLYKSPLHHSVLTHPHSRLVPDWPKSNRLFHIPSHGDWFLDGFGS